MIRPAAIFLLLFICIGCKPSLPKDVIPRDQMENLLFDMVRADEMTAQYALKDSAYRHMGKHTDLYASIFQLHHTTKDAFKRSFRFYESHPEMMSQMINKLQQRAEKWYNSKTEYKNLKP